MSESKLTITIQNKTPIELVDFTDSLKSLAESYYKFILESDEFSLNKEAKLYVKEVKTGSIITVLTDMIPAVIPFVENSNSIIEFTKFIKSTFDYFSGISKIKSKEFDLKDCSNFSNIINPIAKDYGSNMVFTGDFNNCEINFMVDSSKANSIKNGIQKEKIKIKQPRSIIKNNVMFYWDSIKNDVKTSVTMDKGFIDSLNDDAMKVYFEDDGLKAQMIESEENPFHFFYLVDVEIMTVRDVPVAYKILNIKDKSERTDLN